MMYLMLFIASNQEPVTELLLPPCFMADRFRGFTKIDLNPFVCRHGGRIHSPSDSTTFENRKTNIRFRNNGHRLSWSRVTMPLRERSNIEGLEARSTSLEITLTSVTMIII